MNPSPVGAPQLAPALVAVSHGTSSPAGQAAVVALFEAVARETPVRVVGCHVDVQQPDVPAALSSLPAAQEAVIVPLLLSGGFHVHVDLVNEASEADREVEIARALGPDDRLVQLLARRLHEAGLRPGDAVVLGCAGSTDARAVEDCVEMARRLGAVLGREVGVGFISAASPPLGEAVSDARMSHPSSRIVISNYLLAPGYFNDLAHGLHADVVSDPLLVTDGPVPPELVAIILDRYADAAGSALQLEPRRRPLIGRGGA